LSLALSVVFGLAQALPILHFVLVAHRLCAEHGEMLHADGREEAASHDGDARSADEQTRVVTSARESHVHEHCGVVVSAHSHGVGLGRPCGSGAPVAEVTSTRGDARTAHTSIALLRYAPKLAPPAAHV
jgi:hypothetical protein